MNYPVRNPVLPPFPSQPEDQSTWLNEFQRALTPWLTQVTNLLNNSVQGVGDLLTIPSSGDYQGQIVPTNAIHHVEDPDTEPLTDILLPSIGRGFTAQVAGSPPTGATLTDRPSMHTGPIFLIPDDTFTWTATGNIALAGTAVVDKVLIMVWDGTAWHPSYTS